ncbi:MAG: GDP-mannose 4,6-dehydratase [Acidobacteria bacterium]|nr:GDP-mannose 4,6-dehydratase [Acidobacteriota bacterium]
MKRYFVTGANGFVGRHLVKQLQHRGGEVFGLIHGSLVESQAGIKFIRGDMLNFDDFCYTIGQIRPDYVFHMAGQAHAQLSFQAPRENYHLNFNGALNLLESVRNQGLRSRILLVSSGQVYGAVKPGDLPMVEKLPLNPGSPYAASKAAMEQAGLGYFRHSGIRVIVARPFNHVGPGQSPLFVCSDLARQVARAEREGTHKVRVGNLRSQRDFVDVLDAVRAYDLLMHRGKPGEIYNVCTGRPHSIGEILEVFRELSTAPLQVRIESPRIRRKEALIIYGSYAKLRRATRWQPEIRLTVSLEKVLNYWRAEVAKSNEFR